MTFTLRCRRSWWHWDSDNIIMKTYPSNQTKPVADDPVNQPPHYKAHASGIECIVVTEHMNFCLGNAMKYIWRADLKGDAVEDLKKAVWYLNREIQRRTRE